MTNAAEKLNKHLHPLLEKLSEIANLKGIQSLLIWDQETKLPKHSIQARVQKLGTIASTIHRLHTGHDFQKELGKFVDLPSGNLLTQPGKKPWADLEKTLLKEVYRDWKQSTCLSEDFVKKFQETTSKAQHIWADARKRNAFNDFAPELKQIVDLCIEKANLYAKAATKDSRAHDLYDFLLDEFEPDCTVQDLDPVFNDLKSELGGIYRSVLNNPKWQQGSPWLFEDDTYPLNGLQFDVGKQWDFGIHILKQMGFDFDRGYQEVSAHPFTIHFHPDDVRITTRLKETDIFEGFSSTVHEGGHALYEQGIDVGWYGTPFGESSSLGIHESQSRFWENLICNSRAFWKAYYPDLQQLFPKELKAIDQGLFYRCANRIKPGEIRVEADELTYNFHIIIRYEIEKKLINKGVSVEELPELWNAMYKELLDVSPSSHANGVMQDVHWSSGGIGYFPTYTLGNIYASQLYVAMEKDLAKDFGKDLGTKMGKAETTENRSKHSNAQSFQQLGVVEQLIESKQLVKIKDWLNAHVHKPGRQHSANDLVEKITGESLNAGPFLNYLKRKYL